MRAVICDDWGEPTDLSVGDLPAPEMAENGVRIAVRAAGVNFADTLIIKGQYQVRPPLPFSPGLEVAGDVLDCAPGVTRAQPGDRVMANVHYGGFAEQVIADEADVRVIPAAMDFVTAAAFPVIYGTSHIGLIDKLALQAGETLLVNGAAGGVGLTAVEIGKKLGATVIAAAGGPEKLKIAERYGADHLIDYRAEDIRARVKILTAGRGVDAVFDPVGGAAFDAALRAVTQRGRILVVGFASGTVPQVPANILLVKNISVIGYYWGAYRHLDPQRIDRSFAELLSWYEDGALKPHIHKTYDLADVADALADLTERRSTGKIVLTTETRH